MRNRMFLMIVGVLCLLMTGVVHAQAGACASGVNALAQGIMQYDAQAYADALASYTCAVQADPQNDAAHIGRLKSALLVGDYLTGYGEVFLLDDSAPTAIDEAIASLAGQTLSVDSLEVRAFLEIFSYQPQAALEDAARLHELEPDNALAHLFQAAAHELMGAAEEAAAAFGRVVELTPDDPQAYGLMAAVQLMTFNVPGMAENSNRAIELAPDLAHPYRLRGRSRLAMGDPEAALADANKAIELDPTYYGFHILRANALRALGSIDAALEDLNTAIDLNPRTAIGYGIRAQVQLQLGDSTAAAQDFAESIRVSTHETVAGKTVALGESMTLTMTRGRTYRLAFDGQAGQVINISVASVNPDQVDPVLLLVSPDDVPLVFNDDASDESMNAIIDAYAVPQSGRYTLVVSHANGGSEGEIALLVTLD